MLSSHRCPGHSLSFCSITAQRWRSLRHSILKWGGQPLGRRAVQTPGSIKPLEFCGLWSLSPEGMAVSSARGPVSVLCNKIKVLGVCDPTLHQPVVTIQAPACFGNRSWTSLHISQLLRELQKSCVSCHRSVYPLPTVAECEHPIMWIAKDSRKVVFPFSFFLLVFHVQNGSCFTWAIPKCLILHFLRKSQIRHVFILNYWSPFLKAADLSLSFKRGKKADME